MALTHRSRLAATLVLALAALGGLLLLRPELVSARPGFVIVSGRSMEPALAEGDLVLALERSSYQVGDVIAFRVPDSHPGGGPPARPAPARLTQAAPDGRRASMTSDAALTAQIRESMPFASVLGLEMVSASADEVVGRLAWDETLCTAGGIMHGGALMGLADGLGGLLAFLNLPEGANGTATIESKTNFFAAVRSGHVEARSRPLHRGKRTIVVETDLFDADGRHVARVTQTQAILGA